MKKTILIATMCVILIVVGLVEIPSEFQPPFPNNTVKNSAEFQPPFPAPAPQ